jgi:LysR family transcriptional regulator, hydrogen peroxide-inducible genes activator
MNALPSPRQLQYLVTLSETGHFGRAADRCNVTQSTLSAGLKELEAGLGVTLVERTKRHVVVTPLGKTIAARAREVLRYLEDMTDLAAGGAGKLAGPLSLGVIPTIAPYLIPSAVTAIRKGFPDLKLFLREEQTTQLLTRLRQGDLDLALIALPYDIGDLTALPLADEDLVACLPAGHSLTARKTLTPTMLTKTPLLTLEGGHCWREHAWSACRLGSRRANEVFQATSLPTIVQMVAGGLGVTLLPRMAVPVEVIGQKGVVIRPVSPSGPARSIALVWRATSVRDQEFTKLGAILRQACERAIAKGHTHPA